MTREDLLNAWAPPGGTWSLWVRPILFAQLPEPISTEQVLGQASQPIVPIVDSAFRELFAAEASRSEKSVFVLDLPGEESTWSGLALTEWGYWPIPLFNACTGPNEVIPQGQIIEALKAGGSLLASLTLTDGPPVFLLDSRRMSPSRMPIQPSDFDNRWQVFPQDLPSATFLADRGYKRALLIQRGSRQPREDLSHVLRRWQEGGLTIEAKDLADRRPPGSIAMNRPSWYRSTWHRVLTALYLKRNPIGGFGAEEIEPRHG